MMETLGNTLLLERRKIGFFASSRIAALSVLPTLDWAAEIAQREDAVIVSGFQSKMEREVLDFLLQGRCGIVCVLARSIYKKIPDRYREAYAAGRVLFVSHECADAFARAALAAEQTYVAGIGARVVGAHKA